MNRAEPQLNRRRGVSEPCDQVTFAATGVAGLHTELLKRDVLRDFYELWPEKFSNKTDGVTPRRFLVLSNPQLTQLITDTIGEGWITHLDDLRRLETYADNATFQQRWRQIKPDNKHALAAHIMQRTGIQVNPASLFDIQVKRLHEYKRQHLNMLYGLHLMTIHTHRPSTGLRTGLSKHERR